MKADAPRQPLPVALNLGGLYLELFKPLLPCRAEKKDSLKTLVERAESIRSQELELDKAQSRLKKEKQFNRKVEINAEIRTIKQKIEKMAAAKENIGVTL